ncbi:pentapeptide repeat-containing protein [Sphaerisporangium sp. B11E5]|uniref:pentapeptide repeat-containing protein n=1 Tax=Sphaerisporangium sp. B11E5 TaxID=3153563 RepID=UPI00325D19DF
MRGLIALVVAGVVLGLSGTAVADAESAPCRPGSGAKYKGKDFTGGAAIPDDLRCADLTGAKLDAVSLIQKDLTGALLKNASLREADLTQARLEYADLTGADLTDADIGQMHAKHSILRGAVLDGVEGTQAEFPHADLTGAVFKRAVLGQTEFTNATLVDADLTEAKLGQTDARKADFSRAKMAEAELGQAELDYAVFRGADLTEAVFTQAELKGADLKGAKVEGASFTQADDLNLTGALGEPEDVPDDAQGSTSDLPEGDAATGDPGDGTASGSRRGGPNLGLMLAVVGGVGLVLTLLFWGGAHRRRLERAARFDAARRGAEEDVTRLGEAIDALDFDYQIHNATDGGSGDMDWRQALDAYEAARHTLRGARTKQELAQVAQAVHHGHQALGRMRSRLR